MLPAQHVQMIGDFRSGEGADLYCRLEFEPTAKVDDLQNMEIYALIAVLKNIHAPD